MKKRIIYLLAMALVFTTVLSFVPGTENKTAIAAPAFTKVNFVDGIVAATVLNVRQGPAVNYPVVCKLKQGQKVKVFGKIGDWYAVYETSGGCVGAVLAKYIKVGTAVQTPAKKPQTTKPPAATAKPPATTAKPPAATPAPGMTTPPDGVSQEEQQMLDLVNKARADAGVGALQFDMELQKVARLKADDMVKNNYFSHNSPTYGTPFDMMRQFGVSFKSAGENIAGNQTVEGAFKAWMNSEGHRKNILNGNFNYTGIGIVPSPTYGKMFVQMFIGR